MVEESTGTTNLLQFVIEKYQGEIIENSEGDPSPDQNSDFDLAQKFLDRTKQRFKEKGKQRRAKAEARREEAKKKE